MENENSIKPALKLALGSILAALVFVATNSFVIYIPATSGYFNLGETIIFFAALMFGPFVGAFAGAGATLADILIPGAAQFAPGTFLIKVCEGAIVGFLYINFRKQISNRNLRAVVSIIPGGLFMVGGYFLYEQKVLGYPFAVALIEVPFNIVQMLAGLVIAIPIVHIVLRFFPQLKS